MIALIPIYLRQQLDERNMIIAPNESTRIHGQYITFYKGELVSDYALNYIINAGLRGLVTDAGQDLLLLPDTRHGPPDVFGLRTIRKFRKSDCTTLTQLIRQIRKSNTLPKLSKKFTKTPKENNGLKTAKPWSGIRVSDSDFLAKSCVT